jgi:hypothetical protein
MSRLHRNLMLRRCEKYFASKNREGELKIPLSTMRLNRIEDQRSST